MKFANQCMMKLELQNRVDVYSAFNNVVEKGADEHHVMLLFTYVFGVYVYEGVQFISPLNDVKYDT